MSVRQDERTLTVLRLVATPDATDLVYELTDLPGDHSTFPTPERSARDEVALYDGSAEYGQGGSMSISVRAGKLVRSFTMVPLPAGTRHVELRVSGPSIGNWAVPLDLVPFPGPDDVPYRSLDASDTQRGITVTVRGMIETTTQTAFDLMAVHAAEKTNVLGLGGMQMRDESTALTLRDDKGRTYAERYRNDARDQLPDPTRIADVAIFGPLPDDAGELVLEVPTVCFDDYRPTVDVELPVAAPIEARLGEYPIKLLASREVQVARGPHPPVPAIAIDVDFGDVGDPVCVIMPCTAKIDGVFCGLGFGGKGIHAPSPTPLETIEVFPGERTSPRRVTLVGARVRARGPWRMRFHRPH